MFFKVTVLTALVSLACGSPIESHASSYISTSFGSHANIGNLGGDDLGGLGGHVVAAPVITHHAVPLVHKVVTPVIQKVPVYVKHVEQHVEEEHGPAEYQFHYAVEDKHTGDIKSQKEVRHGDQVQGEYSLKEADGTVRIVKYTADKKSGFNAVVIRQGHAAHPQVIHKEVQVKKVVVPLVADHHGEAEYEENSPSSFQVKYCKKFERGRESISGDPKCGKPLEPKIGEIINKVEDLVLID
ncbi:hypothetical protein Trydic_g14144 [Trypoxylus dichotomus]